MIINSFCKSLTKNILTSKDLKHHSYRLSIKNYSLYKRFIRIIFMLSSKKRKISHKNQCCKYINKSIIQLVIQSSFLKALILYLRGYRIYSSIIGNMLSHKEANQIGNRGIEEILYKVNRKKLLNFISGDIKYSHVYDIFGEIQRMFSLSNASNLLLGKDTCISRLLKMAFELINKYTLDNSILNIFKHLFIIHIFIHKSCEKGQQNSQLKNICEEKLILLMKKQFRYDNSIKRKNKFLSFVFSNAQKQHYLYSIQKSPKLHSFVDEIHCKILQPFSLYLMKKFQNIQLYAKIFSPQAFAYQQIWKILNLSNQLKNMIKNANKLLHYYTSQFQWFFLSFISTICLDLNIIVQKLSTQIGNKCSKWIKQIDQLYHLRSSDYSQFIEKQDDLLLNRQLNEVRNMVEELYEIQGGLLFLNQNQKIRSLFHAFSIPSTWLHFQDSQRKKNMEVIADFSIRMTSKLQQGAKKRKNSSETGISQQSFKLFDSMQMPEDLIFEEMS